MRHKSVHQYFKYVISVKIFGPTSTRGSVCSQSIYSIYIYLYLGLLLIAAKNRQGYLSAESFNIIFKSLLGLEALSTYHGLLRTISSPQANMNHEPSIILFPYLSKWEKNTIGCITQTTLHVIYIVIMRSMETVFYGFSLDPPVQRSFERCHAPKSNLQCFIY